jgi:Xaa-Pro aminopeptidase
MIDRLEKLRAKMQENNVNCVLIFGSRNVYYFSGTSQHGCLLVPLDDDPILFVRVNIEIAKKESCIKNMLELKDTSNIGDILSELSLDKGRIGIEEKLISFALYKKINGILPKVNFLDMTNDFYELRMIKDREEIEQTRKAAGFTNVCHKRAKEIVTAGMQENELAAEIEYAMRKAGNEGFIFHRRWGASMFHGMLASGPDIATISGYGAFTITGKGLSPAYPYGASHRKIRKGEAVVIDYVGCAGGYHCDETRTYVVGKAERKIQDIFNILKKIEESTFETIRPGVSVSKIYDSARKAIEHTKYKNNFMGFGKYVGRYVGHGLGLEIDEPPIIEPNNQTSVRAGMVLALEPKIMIPKYGGAALEDTVVVTENGLEIITKTERELLET